MKYIVLLLLFIGCTNAPNGSISYNTTSYYIDGKFTDEIPDSLIIRLYGYKLVDDMNGKEHTYRQPVIMRHNSTITLWCTCLLYTSPSPRDMWTSRMPSSA